MNKKYILALALAALAALSACSGDKEKNTPEEMPKNIISYDEKDGSELIPVDGVEIVGNEDTEGWGDTLPSEEELGEYKEIFMEGDILDEETLGGWVVAVSLKDITVNTYNKLTTYLLDDSAKSAAGHLKPGDAVMLKFYEDESGESVIYDLGRVRVEDEPLTRDEILEAYNKANEDTEDE